MFRRVRLQPPGAEAAVIEGGNSITLTDTDLSSSKEDKWGVMIYQSMSGDADGTRGTFTMTGGSLQYTSTSGPLFYVTNSTGVITLKGVAVTVASGTLVKAATGNWGRSGSNGGTVMLTADGQTLAGNMLADAISSLTVDLKNGSSLTGGNQFGSSGQGSEPDYGCNQFLECNGRFVHHLFDRCRWDLKYFVCQHQWEWVHRLLRSNCVWRAGRQNLYFEWRRVFKTGKLNLWQ